MAEIVTLALSFALSCVLSPSAQSQQEFRPPESYFWMTLCETTFGGNDKCVALYWLGPKVRKGLLIKTHRIRNAQGSQKVERGRLTLEDRETRELLKASLEGISSLAKQADSWMTGGFTAITLDAPKYTAEVHSGNTVFRIDFENFNSRPCKENSVELSCRYWTLMQRFDR